MESVLIQESPQRSPLPLPPWEDPVRSQQSTTQKRPFTRTRSCRHPALGLLTCRLREINFCLRSTASVVFSYSHLNGLKHVQKLFYKNKQKHLQVGCIEGNLIQRNVQMSEVCEYVGVTVFNRAIHLFPTKDKDGRKCLRSLPKLQSGSFLPLGLQSPFFQIIYCRKFLIVHFLGAFLR